MTTPTDGSGVQLPEAPINFEQDLAPFDDSLSEAEAQIMIRSAWAKAILVAPCLRDDDALSGDPAQAEVVKEVLRGAILRWAERGAGAISQRQAGEYSETLRRIGSNRFRPNEIRDLQNVCSSERRKPRASTILTGNWGAIPTPTVHPFFTDSE